MTVGKRSSASPKDPALRVGAGKIALGGGGLVLS